MHMRAVPRVSPGPVISAELVGFGVGALAAGLGTPLEAAVLAGLAIAIACLIPIGGRSAIAWLPLLARLPGYRMPQLPRPTDSDSTIGVSWSGFDCAAVIAVVPRPALTLLSRRSSVPGEQIPLVELAAALSHHDIHLAGIDVISHSRRIQTRAASVLRQLAGPLPAVPSQSVWIVARLDAREGSTDRRGGGRTGAAAALGIATQRISHLLATRGIQTRVLSAVEIDAVVFEIGGQARKAHWSSIEVDSRENVGYSAPSGSPEVFDRLATVPAHSRTTMVALRPVPSPGSVAMSISWRLTAAESRSSVPGRRPHGQQLEHLVAHLPLASSQAKSLTFREVAITQLSSLHLAAGGSGQLVGATSDGKAVAIGLCGPGSSVVTLCGSPLFLRQTVFRSIGTGARMVIRTDRREMWLPLTESIASSSQLRVIGLEDPVPSGFDAVVADGDQPSLYPDMTTIYTTSDPAMIAAIDADAALVQTGDTISVTAGNRTIDVELISLPAERDFIAGSGGVLLS